jgi:hypothetical protein
MKTHVFLAMLAPVALLSATGMYLGHFNQDGNVLIADQFNNKVTEYDPQGHVVWSFGTGLPFATGVSVVAPNDAERVGSYTLISGTGAPPGTEPGCPNGCQDNRVILVDSKGHIVWQYGQAGVPGSGWDQLNAPVCSVYLSNGDILITDQGNERIIEVNQQKQIVWQYGTTGVGGSGENELNNPNSAERLPNGDTLIADESNNRVIEVDAGGNLVWSYGSPDDTTTLNTVAFASRLPNGNTLITDSGNNRVVWVDPNGNFLRAYYTNNRPGSVANPNPTRAVQLANGDVLISDQFNDQVIAVNPDGGIDWSKGVIGVAGPEPTFLNAPYDAKVVGDYTGLTPP